MTEPKRYSGPATVRRIEPTGCDAVLMTLDAPEVSAAAAPGQFVMLRLPGRNDPFLPRPFSVFDVDGGALVLLIRVLGRTTRVLGDLPAGRMLNVVGPLGRGFRPAEGGVRHLLVGGGMGVAPLPYLLRQLLGTREKPNAPGCHPQAVRTSSGPLGGENTHPQGRPPAADALEGGTPQTDVRVLLGAKTREGLHTLDHLRPAPLSTITEDGSDGRKGLVTHLLADALGEDARPKAVYACGPAPMLEAVGRICLKAGVACQLSLEAMMACGTGLCHGCVVRLADGRYGRVCKDGPVFEAAELAIPWTR